MIKMMSSTTTKRMVHPFQTDDPRLQAVHEKVLANEALNLPEVTALYASKDILAIGWLADHIRERRLGNRAQCVVNELTRDSALVKEKLT